MRTLAEQHQPPRSPELIRVIRVPPKGNLVCRVVSPEHWGCWSHWCSNHTEACFCTEEEREENPRQHNHRWKGFLHVLTEQGRQYFLELPRDAMNAVLAQLPEGRSLRGASLTAFRVPEHARGEIQVKLVSLPYVKDFLPPSKNPRPVLERLWKSKLPAGRNAS